MSVVAALPLDYNRGMSTSAYAPPPQREIEGQILSTVGWIKGSFMLPAMRVFAEYLNHPHDFFKLKNVTLPGLEAQIPFFALQRDSVILVLVDAGEGVLGSYDRRRPADVSCAFNGGVVSGTLHLPQGVRVSDFLLQKQRFFHLTDCTVFVRSAGTSDVRRNQPVAIVNARRVIGVSEPRFV